MQGLPNRMGLGMRPPAFGMGGQGPSMGALAQQQQMTQPAFIPQQSQPQHNIFVGSISGGITDAFLNELLGACGPLRTFKRMITPANKPQGFGFAEFETPDGMIAAVEMLNDIELPALEDGCANKRLLVKADEKTKLFIDAYRSQRMMTDVDEANRAATKNRIDQLVHQLRENANSTMDNDKDRIIIPPHLHDLQEHDLPEEQRGLVVSEIALFRERAAKREREKIKEDRERTLSAFGNNLGGGLGNAPPVNVPSGPKDRWGRQPPSGPGRTQQGFGTSAQGYNKPIGFIKAEDGRHGSPTSPQGDGSPKTDLEMETERKEARKREEEMSFRDRERRYEPRERQRIAQLERTIARERMIKEAEERDHHEMRHRLEIWDDDESDETFYTDRVRWRATRRRRLDQEEEADAQSRAYEEKQAENLRRESEQFLAQQMVEMQSLQEEQRKAGMLLDDGAPVKLSMSLNLAPAGGQGAKPEPKKVVLGQEDEEDSTKKKKLTLTKLEFSFSETGTEKIKERLEKIKGLVPSERDSLFKAKVRWDGMNDTLVDRKLEPIVRKKMTSYLGELDDDDLVMFVVEHLKDHKSPAKLVEGLEPVLEDEAIDFTIHLWRQIIFESMAYEDGINTGSMLIDP